MISELTIRFATAEDIPLIEQLAQQIWPAAYKEILSPEQSAYMMELIYSPASLQKQLVQQQHTFLIISFHNQPIGFASYSPLDKPGIYKLHKIYVDSSIRGKGIGKAIIDFIVNEIKGNANALWLNVNRYNKARFFYEKIGFNIIKEEDIDIGNNYFMNDYVMELKIYYTN